MSAADKENNDLASDAVPDDADETDDRYLACGPIDLIIEEMRARAVKRGITQADLRNAYKRNKEIDNWFTPKSGNEKTRPNPDELSFGPRHIGTYGYIFGFNGGDVRQYLPARNGNSARYPPTIRHIATIDGSLKLLRIYEENEAPSFDDDPASWLPFLEFALARIRGEPTKSAAPAESLSPQPTVLESSTDHTAATPASAEHAIPSEPAKNSRAAASTVQDPAKDDTTVASATDDVTLVGEPEVNPSASADASSNLETVAPAYLQAASFTARPYRSRALKVLTGLTPLLLIGGLGTLVYLATNRAPNKPHIRTARIETGTLSASDQPVLPAGASPFASSFDPKLWGALKASSDRSNVGSIQAASVDPRLDKAAQLKASGQDAEADRLMQDVIEDWSTPRTVTGKVLAEARRQLSASAYLHNDFDGSIKHTTEAIKVDPGVASDYNDLGLAFHAKNELIDAIAAYSKAIDADKNFAWPHNNRANAYMSQDPPKIDLAMSDYEMALTIDQNFAEALFNRGLAFLTTHDYDRAIDDFNQAIKLKFSSALAHNALGSAYFNKGDFDLATNNFDMAIKADQDFIDGWINRGLGYLSMNEFDRAIGDLKKAIALIGKSAVIDKVKMALAHSLLGTAYNSVFRPQEALAEFEASIRLKPDDYLNFVGRGLAYGAIRKFDEAYKSFEEAEHINHDAFQMYLARGDINYQKGDFKAALDDYSHVILLVPDLPNAYLGRGTMRAFLGQADAVADLDRAANLSSDTAIKSFATVWKALLKKDVDRVPDALEPIFAEKDRQPVSVLVNAYWLRAAVHSFEGKFDEAIADCTEMLKVDSAGTNIYLARAEVFEKKGDLKAAANDLDSALVAGQNDPLAFLERGEFYKRRRNYDRAESDLDEALNLHPDGLTIATTLLDLAEIHETTNPTRALDDYERILPQYDVVLSRRAQIKRAVLLTQVGEYEPAIEEYSSLLKTETDNEFLYAERGKAFRATGRWNEAIADYTKITTLKREDAHSWDERGDTFYGSGDYGRAIVDYTTAIEKNPKAAYAYYDRGKAHEAQHEHDLAIEDFVEAIKYDPKNARAVLRLYIARAQAKSNSAGKELEENANRLDRSLVLYPVVELFLGLRAPDTVVAAGDEGCETQFYLAKWHMLQGGNKSAIEALNEALGLCSKTDIFYYDAIIALREIR